MNRWLRKHYVSIGIALIIGLSASTFLWFHSGVRRSCQSLLGQRQQEPWLTVFIHGSFGSLLGFLSFFDVIQDKISGTDYRKISKKIRNDSFFYKDQAILARGLIPVQPTFDPATVGNKKYAVYPVTKAYESFAELAEAGQQTNYFYTFGWSGLMSQKSRSFESIRLYNALSEELEHFKSRGITPKIRLICHSHGGNLSLNLAAISKLLASGSVDTTKFAATVQRDEYESLSQMAEFLKSLPVKDSAKTRTDQKIFDYVPNNKHLVIDELIMFGTPLQPETECFANSDMFKHIFNFYSDEDFVQRADWVSSKQPLSGQRLDLANYKAKKHIFQARIITDAAAKEQTVTQQSKESSFLDTLLKMQDLVIRKSKDPTHKELWCMTWKEDQKNFFLSPFPVMVLTPLLTTAAYHSHRINDIDITLQAVKDGIQLSTFPYATKQKPIFSTTIKQSLITSLLEKIKPWHPDESSVKAEFDAIYKYIS